MKNYKESDYALNKYSQGIVYKFVDGALEVTLEDYLHDNPDKTEGDFAELKALSDEIYHEQVVLEHRTCKKNGGELCSASINRRNVCYTFEHNDRGGYGYGILLDGFGFSGSVVEKRFCQAGCGNLYNMKT